MVDVIVMYAVVDGVLELDRGMTPAREFVVVDLGPVVALDQDADGCVDAVATVLSVVPDTLVGVLGRALSTVGADYSEPCMADGGGWVRDSMEGDNSLNRARDHSLTSDADVIAASSDASSLRDAGGEEKSACTRVLALLWLRMKCPR